MLSRKHLSVLGVTLAGVLAARLILRSGPSDDEDRQTALLLVNRFWVERYPKDPRDMVLRSAFLSREGERVGAIGRSSQYRIGFEMFGWRLEGRRLFAHFPQDDLQAEFEARAWRCKDKEPEFELCLELKSAGRSLQFHSRDEWEVGDAPAEARAMARGLRDAPAVSADCPSCRVGLPPALEREPIPGAQSP
jgi:hypothetical protein